MLTSRFPEFAAQGPRFSVRRRRGARRREGVHRRKRFPGAGRPGAPANGRAGSPPSSVEVGVERRSDPYKHWHNSTLSERLAPLSRTVGPPIQNGWPPYPERLAPLSRTVGPPIQNGWPPYPERLAPLSRTVSPPIQNGWPPYPERLAPLSRTVGPPAITPNGPSPAPPGSP